MHLPSLPASHVAQSKLKWIALHQEPAPSVLYLEHLVNGIFITVRGVVKQEKTKTFTPHQSKKNFHQNTKYFRFSLYLRLKLSQVFFFKSRTLV